MYEFLKNGSLAMYIDELGRDHEIDILSVDYYIAQEQYTVKVEGLEGYFNAFGTVHCYIAPKGARSFDPHCDPVDVTIKCIDGIKTLVVDGKEINLHAGESVFIPKGTLHQATNKHSSTMLSIGHN